MTINLNFGATHFVSSSPTQSTKHLCCLFSSKEGLAMLAYWILRTLDNTVKIQEIVFNLVLRYFNPESDMFCSPQNHFKIRIIPRLFNRHYIKAHHTIELSNTKRALDGKLNLRVNTNNKNKSFDCIFSQFILNRSGCSARMLKFATSDCVP